MKSLYMPSADSPVVQWLIFLLFLLLFCVGLSGFIIWLRLVKTGKSKRKKKLRHHRPSNPTLAQTGGLPPRRDPNQPPPGP